MSEMSELTLTIIRLGFLAVLWMFVLTAVSGGNEGAPSNVASATPFSADTRL